MTKLLGCFPEDKELETRVLELKEALQLTEGQSVEMEHVSPIDAYVELLALRGYLSELDERKYVDALPSKRQKREPVDGECASLKRQELKPVESECAPLKCQELKPVGGKSTLLTRAHTLQAAIVLQIVEDTHLTLRANLINAGKGDHSGVLQPILTGSLNLIQSMRDTIMSGALGQITNSEPVTKDT